MGKPSNQTIMDRHARWRDYPDLETSASAQIARRLWAGETLTTDAVTAEYHSTKSLLGVIVRELRQVGWTIVASRDPDNHMAKLYRLTGQGKPLPERSTKPAKKATRVTRAPATREMVQHPPQPVGATYPPLGASLLVKALALTDTGVMLQLSDGNGSAWQVTITGHVG